MSDTENNYPGEQKIIQDAELILKNQKHKENELLSEFEFLLNGYKKLFKQFRRLIKISDKQQHILQRMTITDGLTGISNRRHFETMFDKEFKLALRHERFISAIMIDIDFFKSFNDIYGHQAGDQCLRKVARALDVSLKRPTDLIARYGGEEFVAILPETNETGAKSVANLMKEQVEKLELAHEGSLMNQYLTISLGLVSAIPQPDMTPKDFIGFADQALYQAKESGRNQVITFNLTNYIKTSI